MRLSEERINHIAREMVKRWTKTGACRVTGDRARLETRVAKAILDDLRIEDEIDREARRRLRAMPSAPPEDSPEWDAMFLREREALASRRGYVI